MLTFLSDAKKNKVAMSCGSYSVGRPTPLNNALSARGTAGGKSLKYHQEVILPTCLSLTKSIAALAREVSLGMSGSL